MNSPQEAAGLEKATGYRLWYSDQINEHESNYLIIDDNGNVTANMAYTQTGITPRAIGWHYLAIGHDDAELVAIGRLIREKKMIGGEIFLMPPIAGMRSKIFSIKADGKEARHILSSREELPESFADLERIILRLFHRLGSAPLRALSMITTLEPPCGLPGDALKVGFEFHCTGKFSLDFRNPAYPEEAGGGSLKINLWKKRLDRNGEHLDYVAVLEFAGKEFLLDEKKAVPSGEMFLRIPAAGKLRLWTTIRIPKLNPDHYILEAIYYGKPVSTDEQTKRPEIVTGEFHADLKEFAILKK